MLHTRALLPALLLLAGCVAERPDRKQFTQPDNAKPNQLAVYPDFWRDTNANGYLDSINVTVYLFDTSGAYALSLAVPGTFTFKLARHNGPTIATWSFNQEQARAALRKASAGPTFIFELSILKAGSSDVLEPGVFDLTAEFTTLDGTKIPSEGGASSYRFEGPSAKPPAR